MRDAILISAPYSFPTSQTCILIYAHFQIDTKWDLSKGEKKKWKWEVNQILISKMKANAVESRRGKGPHFIKSYTSPGTKMMI